MTTLAELRTKVSLDLRDPSEATFTPDMVDSFINGALSELSAVWPVEVIDVLPVDDLATLLTIDQGIFRVEWWRDGAYHKIIPQNDAEESIGGWEWFAGTLHVPTSVADTFVTATDELRVWGYRSRGMVSDDLDVIEADAIGEQAIRQYCRWRAYTAMAQERALFAQWQAASNNTDVTENQLISAAALYSREWEMARRNLRHMRRV